MTDHTPGPWRAQLHFAQKYHSRSYAMITANGHLVPVAGALLSVDGYGEDEGRANARLIAAAPEMLLALKHCLGLLCESGNLNNYRNLSDAELGKAWTETAKEAAAIIDKAEGRKPARNAE